MSWIAVGIGAAVLPSVYKGIKGISQSAQANKINPTNPGFAMNYGVLDNAKTLSDQYGNYQLPGYASMQGNINTNYSSAFAGGVKGATSGNDILNLATRMAYGKNEAENQLGVESAQGKQGILGQYLNANAAAGQQFVDKNAYDRQMYEEQLRQKAALTQAGATNTYGAIDQLSGLASKYAFGAAAKNGTDTSGYTSSGPSSLSSGGTSGINPPGYASWVDLSNSGGNTNTFK